ncbi:hypothetical protein LJR220_002428 [Bradyrhizobium sp. LjRoot220]|uniref:hypothetical protein n=1 Tax=Bradyrhizobium sp. LjRoot220 TaxID=3342284 RepID=UPI003ED0989A
MNAPPSDGPADAYERSMIGTKRGFRDGLAGVFARNLASSRNKKISASIVFLHCFSVYGVWSCA